MQQTQKAILTFKIGTVNKFGIVDKIVYNNGVWYKNGERALEADQERYSDRFHLVILNRAKRLN